MREIRTPRVLWREQEMGLPLTFRSPRQFPTLTPSGVFACTRASPAQTRLEFSGNFQMARLNCILIAYARILTFEGVHRPGDTHSRTVVSAGT
jgi:hypothetical protein